MEHDTIRGFDEAGFGQKVKEKFYDEEVIKKDEEWMKADRKADKISQKYTEKDLKRRDKKEIRKVEQSTNEVIEYMKR